MELHGNSIPTLGKKSTKPGLDISENCQSWQVFRNRYAPQVHQLEADDHLFLPNANARKGFIPLLVFTYWSVYKQSEGISHLVLSQDQREDILATSLMNIGSTFLEPDLPKGFGSRTRNGNENQDKIVCEIKRAIQAFEALLKELNRESNHFPQEAALISTSYSNATLLNNLFECRVQQKRNQPRVEYQAYNNLIYILGTKKTKTILNDMINNLINCGIEVRSNARGWYKRVNQREKKERKVRSIRIGILSKWIAEWDRNPDTDFAFF